MSEFRTWMRAMGLNFKQVSTAAEMLGITTVVASHLSRGKRELSQQERLAMAALLAGLKPWDESQTFHCVSAKYAARLVGNLNEIARQIAECSVAFTAKASLIKADADNAMATIDAAKSED